MTPCTSAGFSTLNLKSLSVLVGPFANLEAADGCSLEWNNFDACRIMLPVRSLSVIPSTVHAVAGDCKYSVDVLIAWHERCFVPLAWDDLFDPAPDDDGDDDAGDEGAPEGLLEFHPAGWASETFLRGSDRSVGLNISAEVFEDLFRPLGSGTYSKAALLDSPSTPNSKRKNLSSLRCEVLNFSTKNTSRFKKRLRLERQLPSMASGFAMSLLPQLQANWV
ncbi:hypothetical protein Cni_G02492 [Canna indica]|uniref:Uncharacterized protein n=1 Tax=Canna indica TaxID=4628 RepID=A0AAQ3JS70_9LILI|nr:hypothetical protein Cni_G02492 [Canna indica]